MKGSQSDDSISTADNKACSRKKTPQPPKFPPPWDRRHRRRVTHPTLDKARPRPPPFNPFAKKEEQSPEKEEPDETSEEERRPITKEEARRFVDDQTLEFFRCAFLSFSNILATR